MPRTNAAIDKNNVKSLIGVASQTITISGVSYVQGVTPVPIAVNPSTNRVIIEITIV